MEVCSVSLSLYDKCHSKLFTQSAKLRCSKVTCRQRFSSVVVIVAAEGTFFRANGQVNMSQRIPVTEDPTCVRGFRDEVAAHIIKEAQRQYPEAIKFHFNTTVEKTDLDRQTVYVSSAESGPKQVRCIQ